MYERVIENEPHSLKFVPDYFKTQETCDKVVRDDSSSLQFVPDWFVTREKVDMWYDGYQDDDGDHSDDDDDDEDKVFEQYEGYKN